MIMVTPCIGHAKKHIGMGSRVLTRTILELALHFAWKLGSSCSFGKKKMIGGHLAFRKWFRKCLKCSGKAGLSASGLTENQKELRHVFKKLFN